MLTASLFQVLTTLASVASVIAAPAPTSAELVLTQYKELLDKHIAANPHVARDLPIANNFATELPLLNANKVPDEIFSASMDGGMAIMAGSRGQTNYEPFEICIPDRWDSKGDKIHMACVMWTKALTWDIKRIGERPTDCRLNQVTDVWEVSRSDEQTHSLNVQMGVDMEPFSASIGYTYTNKQTYTEKSSQTVSCGNNFDGVKCVIGGQAVFEVSRRAGWVKITETISLGGKESDPISKQIKWNWEGMDGENAGMEEYQEYSTFLPNPNYPRGWDTWEAEGDQCYVNESAYYPANIIR